MRLAQAVMRQLVDERGLYQWSRDIGLQASDEEVLSVLTKEDIFKGDDGKFSDERFEGFLQNQGYTEASFLEEVRRGLTLQKLRRLVAETSYVSSKTVAMDYRLAETKLNLNYIKIDPQAVKVTVLAGDVDKFLANDKDKARVKEYFDQNHREFNQQEEVRARHILVAFKGARNASATVTRDKEAAQKLASELLAKAKTGQDFAALAKASTDEQVGKTSGGDLGFFTRDKMDKSFSDAAFALSPGQVSSVVETPFGFHVIKVEEKKAAVTKTLEDVQRQIAENLIAKEKRPAIAKEQADRLVADLTAGRPVDALLAQYGLAWGETGDFSAESRYVPGIGGSSDVSAVLGGISKVGQVYGTPINVRGNLFIARLKNKIEPDMKGLDGAKTRELKLMASYTDGSARFSDFEADIRKNLEKKHAIWMNPEYLAMDEKSAKSPTQEGESGE
jgi:peptidyl-prolyl cis-trans isomerase D